jgi:hypothetical protein
MPSKSKAQQKLMAIAEHHPEEIKGKNRGVLKMGKQQLHDFAATKRTGLPGRARKPKGGSAHDPHNAIGSH